MNDLPIQNLKIARFRGLRNLELNDCGRVNLFVGPNNSGKTSVLDALSLFCRPLDISNWREVAWRREIKSARTPLTEPFKWLFPQFLESDSTLPKSIWIHGQGSFSGCKLAADYSEFESFGELKELDSKDLMVQQEGNPEQGLEIRVLVDYAQEFFGQIDDNTPL